jgi:prepilin-type N-terminal cleavage/methylation domain-containing protein
MGLELKNLCQNETKAFILGRRKRSKSYYVRDYKHFRCSRRRGFTLTEMILVLVIIAILTSGVVVSLQGRQDICALEMSGKDLTEAIRFAICESKLNDRVHRLAFYEEHKAFRVEAIDAENSTDFLAVKGLGGKSKQLATGVEILSIESNRETIEPLPDALEFFPDGDGFNGTIHLKNRKDQTTQIQVVGKTGQVYVGS